MKQKHPGLVSDLQGAGLAWQHVPSSGPEDRSWGCAHQLALRTEACPRAELHPYAGRQGCLPPEAPGILPASVASGAPWLVATLLPSLPLPPHGHRTSVTGLEPT